MKKRLVVSTGAGMSAESGIPTFRASDGLWEKHRIEDVASLQGWKNNQDLVLDFYNQRRRHIMNASPNKGHEILVSLQEYFDVHIITQNIDNLHERAGSKNVLHLHGEITKARSTLDPSLIYPIDGWELKKGDRCEKGSQLRPHIVWFGEAVPAMEEAIEIAQGADIFLVVGTSMLVYPAAGLITAVAPHLPKYFVDPGSPEVHRAQNLTRIVKGAGEGLAELKEILLSNPLYRQVEEE